MVNDFNKYKLVYTTNVWILTKEKIASTWLKTHFNYEWVYVKFNQQTLEIEIEEYENQDNKIINLDSYNEISQKFKKEWNLFRNNLESEKKFMFLIRNPIHKFISGWIQDNIIRKVNSGFLEQEQKRLYNFFSNTQVDNFIQYIRDTIEKEDLLGPRYFPDVNEIPLIHKDIYEEFILPSDGSFFKQNTNSLFIDMTTGHVEQDLFMIWNILFKNPYNLNLNKIKILDIDIENLESVLINDYNLPINKKNTFYHTRGTYLKNKTYRYMTKYHRIINGIFNLQLFLWFEIISKIYPQELNNDISKLKSFESYKEKYYISKESDFFNIYSHLFWYNIEPKNISLIYT